MLPLFMILFCTSIFAFIALKIYGVVLCFRKKWYIGCAAIVVPLFPEIVAGAKLLLKKDLLK